MMRVLRTPRLRATLASLTLVFGVAVASAQDYAVPPAEGEEEYVYGDATLCPVEPPPDYVEGQYYQSSGEYYGWDYSGGDYYGEDYAYYGAGADCARRCIDWYGRYEIDGGSITWYSGCMYLRMYPSGDTGILCFYKRIRWW